MVSVLHTRLHPDDRWRRVPTFWLFACQALAVLIVLSMTANDINFDLNTRGSKPARRLVLALVCSLFSLLGILCFVGLYLVGKLHPLLVMIVNTALSFWWLWITFYQKIAMENLHGILDKLCPLAWKNRWLWCQNPKMEFSFSVISFILCVMVVIYAGWTYKRTARLTFDANWMNGGFGWRNRRGKMVSEEDLLPSPAGGREVDTDLRNFQAHK